MMPFVLKELLGQGKRQIAMTTTVMGGTLKVPFPKYKRS